MPLKSPNTASFDRVAFPGDVGLVVPAGGIAPPPESIALVAGLEKDIGVAVAISVADRATRFAETLSRSRTSSTLWAFADTRPTPVLFAGSRGRSP